MRQLLNKLQAQHPDITFIEGDHFYWSPKKTTITFSYSNDDKQEVTLLHELAHALLKHTTFTTDFELLLMEVAAWDEAQALGKKYGVMIPESHIQKCLDTYRDWLHARSSCPSCSNNGIQNKQERTYHCPNCLTVWQVSASRLCRPYRQVSKLKNT